MKIINISSGKSYQLAPNTQIEVERPNLFFNKWGEQSLPIELPDTDLNRHLTGYPDLLANSRKPSANISCVIEDGNYYMPCRQAILGAKRKEKIQTAFYMNEGSFLSRISKVPVPYIFGNETIPGINSVEEGMRWCWSLRERKDENYAIFPIIVELDGERRGVNIVSQMNSSGKPAALRSESSSPDFTDGFYHSFPRTETVDGQIISLSPGYYITPFMRANYLLKRIFQYFGYTLLDNFFTQTEPFKSMVFINNTIDSLVNGDIRLAHLVPDCYCSTLIEVFRKKFCCEFIPDEVAKTVSIELFKDLIKKQSDTDLSACLIGYPEIAFQSARQLKLSSKTSLTDGSTFDSTSEIERKYPTAYYEETGKYKRIGYTHSTIVEIISDGNLPYYAEEDNAEDFEVSVPDCQFCQSSCVYYINPGSGVSELNTFGPYIGDGNTLNSTLVTSGETTDSNENTEDELVSSKHNQAPILSFVSRGNTGSNIEIGYEYSLLYNGPFGIYEKFYRDFDNLLRNALHKVTASLLLTDQLKQSLQVHKKVSINNNDYLVDVMKYSLGGENAPIDTTLLTTKLLEPVSISTSESERLIPNRAYSWVLRKESTALNEKEWTDAGYKLATVLPVTAIYPPLPTKEQYEKGGKYYQRNVYYCLKHRRNKDVYYYFKAELYLTVAGSPGDSSSSSGGSSGGRRE